MKKLVLQNRLIAPLFMASLMLASYLVYYVKAQRFAWTDEDFFFYDYEGNEVLAPTIDTPLVGTLRSSDLFFTYRGVAVGDEAGPALERYDWTDFEFVVFREGEMYGDRALTTAYREKIKDVAGIEAYLDEFTQKKYAIKLSVLVFKQRGRLITRSSLSNYDKLQPFEKLKYTFAIEIEDGEICSVTLDNNYLRELSFCYQDHDGKIPEDKSWDWLRLLGDQ